MALGKRIRLKNIESLHKRKLRSTYLLFLYLVNTGLLLAQTKPISFRRLSTTDGLSQSSVITINQDHLGKMWFGTRDGLNSYDGTNFNVFRSIPEDSTTLSNNDILAIDEDKNGNIWVGTYYGLNCYNPKKNTFKRYLNSTQNSVPNNTIWCIKVLKNEKVWIGTSAGLAIYNIDSEKFETKEDSGVTEYLADRLVLCIHETKNGDVWLGTSEGVCVLKYRGRNNYILKNIKSSLFVQDIEEDEDGNIWVATKYQGLFKYNYKKDIIVNYNETHGTLIHSDVRSLSIDNYNRIWIGTYDGISILNKNGSIEKIINNPYNQNSLSRNTIKSVFRDAKGSIWVGAYYGGINLWDITNSNFTNFSQNTGKNSLSYDVVSSIQKDTHSRLLLGTEGGGITYYNPENQSTTYINKTTVPDLSSNNIKSLFINKDELWIGTFISGLQVYDFKSNRIKENLISIQLKEFLDGTGVYAIKKESDSIMWIGSFGKGLIRYNSQKRTFTTLQRDLSNPALLSGNSIRTLLISLKNELWIGTDRGINRINLNRFNTEKPSIEHYLFDASQGKGEDILTIFEDSAHTIWIGTKYKGLFCFKNNKIKQIPIHYLQTDITTIHAIVEDHNNVLWLSSNQGVIAYNVKENIFTLYDQKDGLISNEFNDNAGLIFNNKIYFGGPAGVSSFDPESIERNQYAPQVILTGFDVQNKPVDYSKPNSILNQHITYTKEVTLDYDKSNFTIHYAIPNFINSPNNLYKYRLKGLDDQWIITDKTEVNYIIQNSGSYIFEVKGANNDEVWNTTPTTLSIYIKPAPWYSLPAFIAYFVVCVIITYIIIRIKKSRTQLKQKLAFEKIESENTRKMNKAKLEFFTNISHEFRTPLTLILGPLQQLLKDYKGSHAMYKKLLVIESSANHLLQLINRLMEFRKLENKQVKLEAAEGNIVKFLREIYLSFTEYATDGKYNYIFENTEDVIKLYYDRVKLESVFYNLLSNAFRYTPKGGTIELVIDRTDTEIIIKIADSGIGIPEDQIDRIFDRFFEIENNRKKENYEQGSGIGLSIAKNIVNLHKGSIKVNNQVNKKGTVFTVTLPLGNSHLSQEDIIKDFKFSDDLEQYTSQLGGYKPAAIDEVLEKLTTDTEKATILIVEDNEPLRAFIKNLLITNYNIIEAENGKSGFDKALKHSPDLIISDVIMPEMVGTELCSAIKKDIRTSHIPVILLTSRSSMIYKYEGLESGANDYISKPFDITEFSLRIINLLESTKRLKTRFSENTFVPTDITLSSLDEKLLEKVLKIVDENIANDQFDIPTFSEELGVSRTMLFTKIKAWTNYTPNEFIMEMRMKRAAQLLEQGKANVSQITYMVGFKNPKYFTKCFQRKYGQTPTEYTNRFFDQHS